MNDIFWMTRALAIANKALSIKEFPVGAILVYNNFEISYCSNSCYIYNFCHAESNIFTRSSFYLSKCFFDKSTLYITLEPCFICFSFITYYRIKRLVFGAYSNTFNNYDLKKITVNKGMLEKESLHILKEFFIL